MSSALVDFHALASTRRRLPYRLRSHRGESQRDKHIACRHWWGYVEVVSRCCQHAMDFYLRLLLAAAAAGAREVLAVAIDFAAAARPSPPI